MENFMLDDLRLIDCEFYPESLLLNECVGVMVHSQNFWNIFR